MDEWVCTGKLKDTYEEFFIYIKPLLDQDPRSQWEKSYEFRTVDLRDVWPEKY